MVTVVVVVICNDSVLSCTSSVSVTFTVTCPGLMMGSFFCHLFFRAFTVIKDFSPYKARFLEIPAGSAHVFRFVFVRVRDERLSFRFVSSHFVSFCFV